MEPNLTRGKPKVFIVPCSKCGEGVERSGKRKKATCYPCTVANNKKYAQKQRMRNKGEDIIFENGYYKKRGQVATRRRFARGQ